MSATTLLARALSYARLGWSVFPLYEPRGDGTCTCPRGPECNRPGKHPRNHRGLRAASNDPERLRHWWSLWPDANIALDTSAVLVVDVDGDEGARSLAALAREHGPLPPTVEASTGRGRHLYFAPDRPARTTSHRLGPGIDTRAVGGYVILPPSRHASGRSYRWRRSPFTRQLAAAPAWLVEALARGPGPYPRGRTRGQGADHSRSARDMALCLRMLREGADDGAIERELYRTSKKIAEEKGANAATYVALTVANARRIHEESAPRATVRSVRLDHFPEQWGKPALTRVRLDLVTDDGEVVNATVAVPSAGYRSASTTWGACFPDVAPESLSTSWEHATRVWKSLRPRIVGRTFHVATRGGSVVWIRASA